MSGVFAPERLRPRLEHSEVSLRRPPPSSRATCHPGPAVPGSVSPFSPQNPLRSHPGHSPTARVGRKATAPSLREASPGCSWRRFVPGLDPAPGSPGGAAGDRQLALAHAPALLLCAVCLGFCLRSHFWLLLLENSWKSLGGSCSCSFTGHAGN